jgi:glycolate oxidase iron-sulfur subunit
MQTHLADSIRDTPQGQEADSILRKCVHCGFCLATCPTYSLLGDELDSPRGRIYLIKQMLEGAPVTQKTQRHLDRCLTCRACETTCPSGVQYGRLLDIGREVVDKSVGRGVFEGIKRSALRWGLLSPVFFSTVLACARAGKFLLPQVLARKIPRQRPAGVWPRAQHARTMLLLDGCVQPVLVPNINAAAARVLDRVGISLIKADQAGCCGAISQHLGAPGDAVQHMKRNIDVWSPYLESGAEAIVITASGCGTQVQEYGHYLRNDPAYAGKAARVSALARDVSQVVAGEQERLRALFKQLPAAPLPRIAFHAPCSLQHGLKISGVVESILADAGFQLTAVPDSHLCCGSAGTYSLLQPELSRQLLSNKVTALESDRPDAIATANIGCLTHIDTAATRQVRHWIEILDERLR